MAHFAKLDENNTVLEVNVVDNSDILDENGQESEAVGIAFLTAWSGGYANWKQTSYNGTFRKNYAGIGHVYDPVRDAFYCPVSPFPSWTLDETTCRWEAPVPLPTGDHTYRWDEANQLWVDLGNFMDAA